jgi:AbrB family looped-hinge helix DNA binding protein
MSYTLTTKAQVTLPKAIREHLRVAPGDAVEFRICADGSVRVEPASPVASAIDSRRLAAAQKRFAELKGSGRQGGAAGTDALMELLRGFEQDGADPGFEPAAKPVKGRPRKSSPRP